MQCPEEKLGRERGSKSGGERLRERRLQQCSGRQALLSIVRHSWAMPTTRAGQGCGTLEGGELGAQMEATAMVAATLAFPLQTRAIVATINFRA